MNFQVVWAAIQPLLTLLLASPQFQVLVAKIIADMNAKIVAGIHPDAAVQHAVGQIGAVGALHLTGNPMADFAGLLANFRPPTGGPTLPPVTGTVVFPPVAGTFNSTGTVVYPPVTEPFTS